MESLAQLLQRGLAQTEEFAVQMGKTIAQRQLFLLGSCVPKKN